MCGLWQIGNTACFTFNSDCVSCHPGLPIACRTIPLYLFIPCSYLWSTHDEKDPLLPFQYLWPEKVTLEKARCVQVSPAPATFCLSEFHTYYEEIFVLSLEIFLAFPLLLRTSQLTSQMIPYLLIHFGRYQSPRQTWNKSEKSQIALVSDKLMPVVHLYDRIIVAVTDRNHDTIGREGLLSGTSIIANQLSTCSCLMICILHW